MADDAQPAHWLRPKLKLLGMALGDLILGALAFVGILLTARLLVGLEREAGPSSLFLIGSLVLGVVIASRRSEERRYASQWLMMVGIIVVAATAAI